MAWDLTGTVNKYADYALATWGANIADIIDGLKARIFNTHAQVLIDFETDHNNDPAAHPGLGGSGTLSNATPQGLGTAAAGTGTAASRDDHVHDFPSLEVTTIASTVAGLAASGAVTTHVLEADPHEQYALEADLGTAAAADTTDFDAAGAAAAAQAAAIAASQPLSSYLTAVAGGTLDITGDTTLTVQRSHYTVTTSCAITLLSVASCQLGVPMIFEYHGNTSAVLQIIGAGTDKIEGADRVWATGRDIVVVLVPYAAGRVMCSTLRGDTYIPLMQTPLTGSTLTQTNAIDGNAVTYSTALTDTGSTTTAAAGGFAQVPKTGSTFTGVATSSCSIVTAPFSGITDAWGRGPGIGSEILYIAARGQQTANPGGAASQINSWVGIIGSTKGSTVRGGASGSSSSGNLICAYRDGISSKSVELPASSASTALQWLGIAVDTRNKTFSRAMLTTNATATAGVCGKDFAPPTYMGAEMVTFGQDCTSGSGLWLASGMVSLALAGTCTTTGRTFTWDYATLMRVQVGS